MKLRSVIKRDKKNKKQSKKSDDGVMSANCDFIVIFLIYGQFEPIWKPDSGCIVCKTYIFNKSNFFFSKN